MNRALVTGSAGFLGRHFAAALDEAGWAVRCCDPADDSGDALVLFRAEPRAAFDLVVHCAAVVGGRAVIDGDPLAQAVNLELDAALFGWARQARPGRVLYISSPAAYPVSIQGTRWHQELAEDEITPGVTGNPDRLYGWVKLTGEYLCSLARWVEVPVTVVRPFSGYGEDQSAGYPFPAMIDRALAREDPFDIWGSGDQVRDWIHVDDVVACALRLAGAGVDGPVNLGSGQPVVLRDLARWICQAAGYRPEFRARPDRPAGVAYRVADDTLMRRLGLRRSVALGDGIARALEYRKELP